MEYVDQDLGQVLPNRPLSKREAHEMLGPLLDALSHIHSKGFAHSHIKPSNIMAIGDQLKLSSDTAVPLGETRPAYRPLDAYDAPEAGSAPVAPSSRSEEHTSELQSRLHLVCRLLLEKKKK